MMVECIGISLSDAARQRSVQAIVDLLCCQNIGELLLHWSYEQLVICLRTTRKFISSWRSFLMSNV